MLRIAACQIDIAFADRAENLRRMTKHLELCSSQGAGLVIFPECAYTGYCFESLDEARQVAEPVPGPGVEKMADACRRTGTHAIFGTLEQDGARVFNACVLVGPNGLVASYRKIHLPFLGVDRFTTPGDRQFAVHEALGAKIGMNICYDGAFPESARVMTLLGADLIVLPTNWPPKSECMASCAVNARAMENHIYYAAVNRVGEERGFRFIGMSRICAPGGDILAEAMHPDEAVIYADIDVSLARNKHLVRRPGLHEINRIADRRPDMYGPLTAPK